MLKTHVVTIENPQARNLIFGQSHFIKTVEDVYEVLVAAVPGIQFGLAFCEASGPRLIRTAGTHPGMIALATKNAQLVAAGHTFFIFLENAYPINILNALKSVPEIVRLFVATANPLEVIVGQTDQGRGVIGVIDGGAPLGVEEEKQVIERKELLRKIGYKL